MPKTECPDCLMKFCRRDVMLRHYRNKHLPKDSPRTSYGTPPPPPPPPQAAASCDDTNEITPQLSRPHIKRTSNAILPENGKKDVIPNEPKAEETVTLIHPFTMIVSGPTGCGKTFLLKQVLNRIQEFCKPTPQRIVWLYKRWQPLYDLILRVVAPKIEFIQGIPFDLDQDNFFDTKVSNMIVIDDLMSLASKDPRINDLFTEGSHHRNLSVIVLNQNLYFGKDPTQRRNCQYLTLFSNPIDKQPIATLARQMYPGKANHFLNIFQKATNNPYGYLFVDLKPNTKENLRLRGNVFTLSRDSVDPDTDDVTPVATNDIKGLQVTKYSQFQSELQPVNTPEFQFLDDMPSCDDCGLVFDNIHDVQRHIKENWCPAQQKRRRESDDEEPESPKKTKWLSLSDVYDSDTISDKDDDDVDIEDNDAYQKMYTNAQNQNDNIWEKKANKYVEEGMTEKEARLQADEDIREFIRRDFFKLYTKALEQELSLNNSLVHREMISKIKDLVDENASTSKAIRKTMKSYKDEFDVLFDQENESEDDGTDDSESED